MQAILFDLDGVITDTAEYHYQAWKRLAESLNIEMDHEFNENLKGIPRMESLDRILIHGNQVEDFSEEEKKSLTEKKNKDYQELIKQISPEDLLPGIKDLLEKASKTPIKLIICSSSRNASTIIEQLEVGHYFDGIVDPSSLINSKPDPEIYIEGAKLAGCPLNECVGIEDAEAGIQAINNATMVSIGIGKSENLPGANYVIEDTKRLTLELIEEVWEKYHI